MSHNIYHAIRDAEFKSKAEQDLMFILATYGNAKGQNIFPGVTLLAQKLRSTERYTQILLKKLEREGFIVTKDKKGGRNRVTHYEISFVKLGIERESDENTQKTPVTIPVAPVAPSPNGRNPKRKPHSILPELQELVSKHPHNETYKRWLEDETARLQKEVQNVPAH